MIQRTSRTSSACKHGQGAESARIAPGSANRLPPCTWSRAPPAVTAPTAPPRGRWIRARATWYRTRAQLAPRPCGRHGHGVPGAGGGSASKASVSPSLCPPLQATTVTQVAHRAQRRISKTRNQKHQTITYDQQRFWSSTCSTLPRRAGCQLILSHKERSDLYSILNVRKFRLSIASWAADAPGNGLPVIGRSVAQINRTAITFKDLGHGCYLQGEELSNC